MRPGPIEGLALRRAYDEIQNAAALDFLKDFAVAREIKRAHMPPGTAAAEARISLKEGPPSYVSLKMAMLLRDSGYTPGLDRTKDPFFYNYAYVNGYLDGYICWNSWDSPLMASRRFSFVDFTTPSSRRWL